MQGSAPALGQPLNRLPHHEVVSSKFLLRFVGCAEFVNGIAVELKKNGASDAARGELRKNNKAGSLRNDLVIDVLEKSKRLRRQSMAAARATVKLVELPNPLCGGAY